MINAILVSFYWNWLFQEKGAQ